MLLVRQPPPPVSATAVPQEPPKMATHLLSLKDGRVCLLELDMDAAPLGYMAPQIPIEEPSGGHVRSFTLLFVIYSFMKNIGMDCTGQDASA